MLISEVSKSAEVVPVDKDSTVPFTGILFSPQAEYWARTDREINLKRIENFQLQLNVYKDITKNQETTIGHQTSLNQELADEVERQKKQAYYWGIGGTLAGILLTTLVISQVK